ncbi:hypothetical protein NW759_017603 [Fusarium solani]|nr:hypothetical protein NW759_017603 [Fusarium solani]
MPGGPQGKPTRGLEGHAYGAGPAKFAATSLVGETPAPTAISTTSVALSREEEQSHAPEDYFQAYLSDGELMRDPETVQKENSSSAPQPAIMTEETGAFEMGDICFEDLNRAATQDTILDSPQNILEGSFDTHPLDGKVFHAD